MSTTYFGSAASLNGQTITFNPGDQIEITDETPAAANVTISGNMLQFTGGSITINNMGPGRYVIRSLGNTGTDIRLQQDAHNDFNGDGRSDILWRNDSGLVTDWLAQSNGSFYGNSGNVLAQIDNSWHIAGTGDFNGDGRVDILWRNDSGLVTDWLSQSNGGFYGNSGNFLAQIDNGWQIVGTGDFNADGRTDILWRNSSGLLTDWLAQSNGGFYGNSSNFLGQLDTSWHVAGTGDFNGDGVDDFLLRKDDGTVTDWLGQPNGSFVQNNANFQAQVGTSWHIAGTGDFNGDGLTDILWVNDSGQVTDWLGQFNGTFHGNSGGFLGQLDTSWHVVQTGDFNGDAIDDILWRNNDGSLVEWLGQSNGSFAANANFHSQIDNSWHIVPQETVV